MTWLPPIDQDHTELSSRAHASSLDPLALLSVPEARQDLPVPFTRAPALPFTILTYRRAQHSFLEVNQESKKKYLSIRLLRLSLSGLAWAPVLKESIFQQKPAQI